MDAGFAKFRITPPLGTRMLGFAVRDLKGGAESVHDDLFVRALYLRHNGERALVISYDLLFWARRDADHMLGILGRTMELLPRQVLINFTHTHMGPALGSWGLARFGGLVDELYLEQVQCATLEAAQAARRAAQPVTITAGMTSTDQPISRRRPDGQGNTLFAPNPKERTCRAVPICMMRCGDGRPVAVLFSASCHPSTITGHAISADYPGAAVERINRHLGADVAMFLQGCAGDTKPRIIADADGGRSFRCGTWDEVQTVGQSIADQVIACIDSRNNAGLSPVAPALATDDCEMPFPLAPTPPREFFEHVLAQPPDNQGDVRRLWARRQLDQLDRGMSLPTSAMVRMQCLKLGNDLRLIGIEGEPVADFAHWVLDAFGGASGGGVTFPLGYTFSQGLYLPSERMLPEGGYEVESYYEYGLPAPLAPGYESVFKQSLAEVAQRCAEAPPC